MMEENYVADKREYDILRVATVALAPFHEKSRRGRMRIGDARRRLENIGKTGYEVPNVQNMNQEDLFFLVCEIKGKIRQELADKFPKEFKEMIATINDGRTLKKRDYS